MAYTCIANQNGKEMKLYFTNIIFLNSLNSEKKRRWNSSSKILCMMCGDDECILEVSKIRKVLFIFIP